MDPTQSKLLPCLKIFQLKIVRKSVKIKIAAPKPTLFMKSDSMYSLTTG